MGTTVPGMTEIGTDWRVVDGVATAWFDAPSLIEGAALAGRIVELSAEIVVDLHRDRRAGAPRLRRARRGGVGGHAGSRAGREPCRAAAPERRVRIREPDCGEAVLAARARLRAWGGRRFGGSVAARPAIRIRQSTEPRPLRNRIHLDVVRPAAAVEQASLGEASGPFGVCHTDPDGNEVDLVPGDALGERIGTADWQAVFSAMACYRTTSPTQQRDLAAAAAALADDTGFPLLVDLRPGLVIIDSGKDQWEDDAHGLELDFTDLAGNLQTAARELGATADPGLPRFAQLFLDAADVAAVRRVLGRRTRIHRRPASRGHRHPRSAAAEPGAGVPRARCFGDGAAPAAQPHPLRARGAVGPRADRASPRPSQPVAGSLTSRRIAGGSPTPKATKW